MRKKTTILATTVAIFALLSQQVANASFFGYSRALKANFSRIQLDEPTLPPFAHSRFCIQYPADCEVHRMAFRGGGLRLTLPRWVELVDVNSQVNRAIKPERMNEGVAGERWLLSPKSGDCNDYAVTKRHQLLERGWPSHALLLAEVVTSWGEHHLVLVIRTSSGDLVADSLHPSIRPWAMTNYRWVRVQTPQNPSFWAAVANARV
jgi:predicted transglutaminase-like cysteine proteinase